MNAPTRWWTLAVGLYAAEVLLIGTLALPLGAVAGVAVTDCTRPGRELVCSSPWQMPVSVLPMIALLATVAVVANHIHARRGRIRPVVVAAIVTLVVQVVIAVAVVAAARLTASA